MEDPTKPDEPSHRSNEPIVAEESVLGFEHEAEEEDVESAEQGELGIGAHPWTLLQEDVHVTGTLIWYYTICRREAWLMAHQITPDEDNPNIEFGRFLHKQRYRRERKEESIQGGKIDFIKITGGNLLVAEVKKSSRYEKASRMQILFYLKRLDEQGVVASGELRIPEEKKKVPVELSDQTKEEVAEVEVRILKFMQEPSPPVPEKTSWCRNCGYRDFCWS